MTVGLLALALLAAGASCSKRRAPVVEPCRGDGDCGPPLVCRAGACRACVDDGDCPAGMVCEGSRCFRPFPGPAGGGDCNSDADCHAGRVCRGGECIDVALRAPLRSGGGESVLDGLVGTGVGDAFGGGTRPKQAAPAVRHVFPSVDAPDAVAPATPFAVLVALGDEQETPEAAVVQGAHDAAGRLPVAFAAGQEAVAIDAVISAPGFTVRDGNNTAHLVLPRAGPAPPVKFELSANPLDAGVASLPRPVFITLWRGGAFVAKVRRAITVRAGETAQPATAMQPSRAPSHPEREPELDAAALQGTPDAPDLTVLLLRNPDPGAREDSLAVVNGPSLQPMQGRYPTPRGLPAWLATQYLRFSSLRSRGVRPIAPDGRADAGGNKGERGQRVGLLEGFGEILWERFCPEVFRSAFWSFVDGHPGRIPSILVLTDDPSLPWELMRPVRTRQAGRHQTQDRLHLLGVQARIGRWHVDAGGVARARPPTAQPWAGVVAIAPAYRGVAALPGQERELAALAAVPGAVRFDGRMGDLQRAFAEATGIVHFAGHGTVENAGAGASYVLELADGRIDVMTWRGLAKRAAAGAAPLYFFNACDVGAADGSAGFVDGWAPAVLESGAAGFIGGLWPLGDAGAADFAARFYAGLAAALHAGGGEAEVAELLRAARRGFYETGDPTYLAYVFYGDPLLRLVREPAPFDASRLGSTLRNAIGHRRRTDKPIIRR